MASLVQVRNRALEIALGELGVREFGGNNRGPRVEEYQCSVGLVPGEPWCAAFVNFCYQAAARELMAASPLIRTGGCAKLWFYTLKARPLWCSNTPSVGAIAVHLKDPTNEFSLGHCGIVLSLPFQAVKSIEGNTNEAGDRDGDCVGFKTREPTFWNAGFINVGNEGPEAK